MDEEIITQVVQIPYSDGQTARTGEIVNQVRALTGLETRETGFAALFRGSGPELSHAELQATVEAAMPPDWQEHFYAPMQAEQGAWPADSN